jgi:predicted PurR-regulated permease PerM
MARSASGCHVGASIPLGAPVDNDRFVARVLGVAAMAALGYAVLKIVWPFLTEIAWAAILTVVLRPLNARLKRKLKPGLSAMILTLGVFLVVLGPLSLGAVAVVRQSGELMPRLEAAADKSGIESVADIFSVPLVAKPLGWLQQHFRVDPERVKEQAADGFRKVVQAVVSSTGDLVSGALMAVVSLILVLLFLFFLLKQGEEIAVFLSRVIPLPESRKRHLANRVLAVTEAVVFGAGLTALVQGTLVAVALLIAGFSTWLVLGVIATLASFVPLGGTALVWAPCSLFLLAQGRPTAAGLLALWGLVGVSSADNFLRPILISGRAEISIVVVFVGVLGGLAAFGLVGLFVGPVILSLALALIEGGIGEENPPAADSPPG